MIGTDLSSVTFPPKPVIREEVVNYLKACANLLGDNPEAHKEFLIASHHLLQKEGMFTDQELLLVQDMMLRLSEKYGNS